MPCYDKKLEASRQDFYDEAYATRDVDCVITTGELELMMRERGFDISQPLEQSSLSSPSSPHESENGLLGGPHEPGATTTSGTIDTPSSEGRPTSEGAWALPTLLNHPGTSSGSYLHSLLALQLTSDPSAELTTRQVRGTDFEEYVLRSSSETGKILFKGARCYGFRNLQNVVRKVGKAAGVQVGRGAAGRLANAKANSALRAKNRMKARNKKGNDAESGDTNANGTAVANGDENDEDRPYDYVEIMACPGGCVNGGGQLKPVISSSTSTLTANGNDGSAHGTGIEIPNGNSTQSSALPTLPQHDADMRWGTRAWTRRVEEAYWHDLPTPPPSPLNSNQELTLTPSSNPTASASASPTLSQSQLFKQKQADALALQILSDLCLSPILSPSDAARIKSWNDPLPERAESLRRALFRTSYREVVSEVSGIQVQW